MAFTQRDELADKITMLIDAWYSDGPAAADISVGRFVADALLRYGWIVPEITPAEADGVVAARLIITPIEP